MKRVKPHSSLHLGKPCETREVDMVERARAKRKCTKDSDSCLVVVRRDDFEDTANGVGELATKKRSVGIKNSTQRAIHHKTRCKETFVSGQTQRRKGKVTASPKGKGKGKGKGKRKIQEMGTTTRTRLDLQTKELDSAGWMILGKNVRKLNLLVMSTAGDEFEMPRVDRAAYVFRVHSCKSVMSDRLEMPSSWRRVVSSVQGSEEPAGTHETEPGKSKGEELLAAGCRDGRPIVDSGSVVSTCPVDYATLVPTEKVNYSMNVESVLGESLRHYGIKRNVPFTNRTGGTMSVKFEVTDSKRAILSVHKGCGNGSMVVFTLDGRGKIINDKRCIEHVQQIVGTTPGFDTVYDRRAYVLDVDVNDGVGVNDGRRKSESDSEITFPVIRTGLWERALSQAQQDYERKRANHQDVHGENQNTFEQVKVQGTTKPCEPTSPTKPHIVLSVLGVRSASKPRALTEDTRNSWWTRNIFL